MIPRVYPSDQKQSAGLKVASQFRLSRLKNEDKLKLELRTALGFASPSIKLSGSEL
jgi:hypothetical protein